MEPYITGPVTPSGDVVLGEAGELHAQVALSFPDEGRATHRWPLSPPQAGPLSGFRNGPQKGLFKGRGPKAALVTKGHCRSIHRMERQGELTRSPQKCDRFIYQMKTHSQDVLKVTMGNWLNLELNTCLSDCFSQLRTQPLD